MKKTTMTTIAILFLDSLLAIAAVIFKLIQKYSEFNWSMIEYISFAVFLSMFIATMLLFKENMLKTIFTAIITCLSIVITLSTALGLLFTVSKEVILTMLIVAIVILILTIVFNIAINAEKKNPKKEKPMIKRD